MNPENNALNRTFFIGGPPRIGKTILASVLAERVRGHVVSTDSIRNAAQKACTDKDSDLFIISRTEDVSEQEWLKNHLEHPEIIVEHQNRESAAFWPSVVSFCNSFCEDDMVHIVEGVALLPSLVAQMEYRPSRIVFVGNTNEDHLQSMWDFAERNPEKDWMKAMNYSRERFQGMASFVRAMSLYFKAESEKYGFMYREISDADFEQSIKNIVDELAA